MSSDIDCIFTNGSSKKNCYLLNTINLLQNYRQANQR